jgi:cysteine-rich repeat protein
MTRKCWLLAPFLALFALAACNGDDDSQDDDGSGTDSATDATGDDGGATGDDGGATGDDGGGTGDDGGGTTSEAEPVCGDGTIEGDEECDDGNTEDGDFCASDCTLPVTEAWTVTHDGDDHGRDQASAVVLDGDDNIYVLGREFVDGENGNLWLRVLDPDGATLWTYTYAGEAGELDGGADLAWHPSGDLIVVGWETVTDQEDDILVMRLSNEDPPTVVWKDVYSGPDAAADSAGAVAVDTDGNVYVIGSEDVPDEDDNLWLRMYDPDGLEQWTETHNGADNRNDRGAGVALDASGNIFAAGATYVEGEGNNGWLRMYDATPAEVWTIENSVGAENQGMNAVMVDSAGDVVVAGYASDGSTGANAWLRKLDPSDGSEIWTDTFDGAASQSDSIYEIALDANDDILCAGITTTSGDAGLDMLVRKVGSDGTPKWAATHAGEAAFDDIAADVAVDSEDNVIVVGYETVLGQDRDVFVRKYVQAGP